ncbi:hypothetical protein, membrane [gut metagenome]|uniref:DUF4153 domain-containing protein n=1 Tax=gut metagenome TaxID=749906 RepID=J9FGL7_9ZZZZ
MLLKKLSTLLTDSFRNCLKRFPVTICFAVALSVFLCYLYASEGEESKRVLIVWRYYLAVGTLLSLSLHLWTEEMRGLLRKVTTHLIGHALLLVDTLCLYYLAEDKFYTELALAHVAGIFAIGLSVFFLSFLKEKNDLACWNFTYSTFCSFFTAFFTGLLMTGGGCLLAYSLEMLFGIKISYKYYAYISIVGSVLLPILLFIGLLPSGAKKFNREAEQTQLQDNFVRFLFLPLLGGYLIVLYLYAARILVQWELPTGWVSWLTVALMTGCITVEWLLYPGRMNGANRMNERIVCWLPVLTLPLLVLMTVGILRRFNDYGITVNRLYLLTLNGWFYLVCIGLIINKARRIIWIPISFSLIFLLTSVLPINFASIAKHTLHRQLKEKVLTSRLSLPLTVESYIQWMDSLPLQEAIHLNDRFRYLKDWFGQENVEDMLQADIPFYNIDYKLTTREEGEPTFMNGCVADSCCIPVPDGFNCFTQVSLHVTFQQSQNDTLAVSVEAYSDQSGDSIYISLQQLNEFSSQQYIPLTLYPCLRSKNLFALTQYYLSCNKLSKKEWTLDLNGHLFKKQ